MRTDPQITQAFEDAASLLNEAGLTVKGDEVAFYVFHDDLMIFKTQSVDGLEGLAAGIGFRPLSPDVDAIGKRKETAA